MYPHYKIKNVFAGVVVAVGSSAIDFIYIELFTGRSLIRMLALLTLRLILCFILHGIASHPSKNYQYQYYGEIVNLVLLKIIVGSVKKFILHWFSSVIPP